MIGYKEASELVDKLCELMRPKLPNIELKGAAGCTVTTAEAGDGEVRIGQIDAWPGWLRNKVLYRGHMFTVLRPSSLEPASDGRAMIRFDCNKIKELDLAELAELMAKSLAKSLGEYE